MDRDEALKLLRGGPDGISEWNRLRYDSESIPDLSEPEASIASDHSLVDGSQS
jgi:hypothetical protein